MTILNLRQATVKAALETWYNKADFRHLDPRHPAIKLAGEAGELLDLYGKHEYKPDFTWWQCKHCNQIEAFHEAVCLKPFTSLVLDELGDWFYYWRILCYQDGNIALDTLEQAGLKGDIFSLLTDLAEHSVNLLVDYKNGQFINTEELCLAGKTLLDILATLDCSIEKLAELNYRKLNDDPTHNGWQMF